MERNRNQPIRRQPSRQKSRTKTCPSEPAPYEEAEQIELFSWAAMMSAAHPALRLMYAIPNGGSRRPMEAMYLKASGVKKGVPDICLPVGRGGYHALYIELKRVKGGRVSPDQRQMLADLNAEGNFAVVCRGSEDAKKLILAYLHGEQAR